MKIMIQIFGFLKMLPDIGGSVFKVYFKKNEDYTLVCSVDEMGKRIETKGESNAGIPIKKSQTRKVKRQKTRQKETRETEPVKSELVEAKAVDAKAELCEKSVIERTSLKRSHDLK
jgi:hypothetical protein